MEWIRSVGTEMLVVVVSILLAFQVDEWREAAARDETMELVSDRLHGDLQSDVETLGSALGAVRRAQERIREAIPLVQKGPPFSAEEVTLLEGAMDSDFLYPSTYTPTGYELLVSEGLMTRLPSLELQSALIERAMRGGRLEDRRIEIQRNFRTRQATEYFTVGVRETTSPMTPLGLRYDLDAIRPGDAQLQAALADALGAQTFWAATLQGQLRLTLRADSLLATSR